MEQIKVGVIGCGYWGPNYVRVFNEMFPSSVRWCCDLDQKKIDKFRNIVPNVTTDYKDILNDSSINAVCVSTPATTHFGIVSDALRHGKHVLVEKPLTTNFREAVKLREEARKANKALLVGHIYRYHPAIIRIKQAIISGEVGRIYYGHSSRMGLGPIRHDVNAMWDLAPHDLSEFIYLFSELPLSVKAEGKAYLGKKEDVVFLSLAFPNNKIAKIHVSWLDPVKVRRLTIVGSDKMIVYDDVATNEMVKFFDRNVMHDSTLGSFGEFKLVVREGDILIPKLDYSEPLKVLVGRFIELIGNPVRYLEDIDGAINIVRILECAQESINNGSRETTINYQI